jgi:hypothetical protein
VQHERQRAELDPDLLAAAAEVDRAPLRWARSLSPREKLRHAASMNRTIERLRRAKTQKR